LSDLFPRRSRCFGFPLSLESADASTDRKAPTTLSPARFLSPAQRRLRDQVRAQAKRCDHRGKLPGLPPGLVLEGENAPTCSFGPAAAKVLLLQHRAIESMSLALDHSNQRPRSPPIQPGNFQPAGAFPFAGLDFFNTLNRKQIDPDLNRSLHQTPEDQIGTRPVTAPLVLRLTDASNTPGALPRLLPPVAVSTRCRYASASKAAITAVGNFTDLVACSLELGRITPVAAVRWRFFSVVWLDRFPKYREVRPQHVPSFVYYRRLLHR